MSESTTRFAVRARLVLPVSSPPLDGGIVTIDGHRIIAVGENASPTPPRDLGNVALLPGLINAHTHLEFSLLSSPLGQPGMTLPDWIRHVVLLRRASADEAGAPLSVARRPEVIRAGLRQCLQGGATTVADIATWDTTGQTLDECQPQMVALRELIGLSEQRIAEQLSVARQFVSSPTPSSGRALRGLSPHAPYTAAPQLVRQATQMSARHRCLVAMHLAESTEELELLANGSGPFRDLLQEFGVWNESSFARGTRPLDYLQKLATAHRALVVHGNYLATEDWQWLSRHRASMSVVYCARTHAYFEHAPYPLNKMLQAGVRVVLGTDGRASNPDLNLWRELQFAAQRHTDVDPQQLLRMVTVDAAQSIGLARQVGSLECGKRADMIEVPLDGSLPSSLGRLAGVLRPDAQLRGVWMGGTRCWSHAGPYGE